MTQVINGDGIQEFKLGTKLDANHGVGVRGTFVATMEAFNTEFAAQKTSNGWQKLPSGIILQWGGFIANSSGGNIVFPFAFPNACLNLSYGCTNGNVQGTLSFGASTKNGVPVWSSSAGNVGYNYLAIGW